MSSHNLSSHNLSTHPPALCVSGVALTALGGLWWRSGFPWSPRRLAWQAWHLATSTCGLRGTLLMSPFLDRNDSLLFCFVLPGTDFIAQMLCPSPVPSAPMFGVFPHIFVWGSCVDAVAVTAVGVAGVAHYDTHLFFTWQAWYLVTYTHTYA